LPRLVTSNPPPSLENERTTQGISSNPSSTIPIWVGMRNGNSTISLERGWSMGKGKGGRRERERGGSASSRPEGVRGMRTKTRWRWRISGEVDGQCRVGQARGGSGKMVSNSYLFVRRITPSLYWVGRQLDRDSLTRFFSRFFFPFIPLRLLELSGLCLRYRTDTSHYTTASSFRLCNGYDKYIDCGDHHPPPLRNTIYRL